jgi:hypothetical protein
MATLRVGDSNGCWVELFAGKRLRGAARRLYGPADFPHLRVREPGAAEQVQSLRVGPNAYVQCFAHGRFEETVFWLLPNESVLTTDHLRAADEVDSLRLYDRPPFAHEPAYAAYMLWAASQLAHAMQQPNGSG